MNDNYGIEDFYSQQESADVVEDFGDENDDDVLEAEDDFVNSWAYKTFENLKSTGELDKALRGQSSGFIIANQYSEEDKWGWNHHYYVIFDIKEDRFFEMSCEGEDEIGDTTDFDVIGELFPMHEVVFSSNPDTQLTGADRLHYINSLKGEKDV